MRYLYELGEGGLQVLYSTSTVWTKVEYEYEYSTSTVQYGNKHLVADPRYPRLPMPTQTRRAGIRRISRRDPSSMCVCMPHRLVSVCCRYSNCSVFERRCCERLRESSQSSMFACPSYQTAGRLDPSVSIPGQTNRTKHIPIASMDIHAAPPYAPSALPSSTYAVELDSQQDRARRETTSRCTPVPQRWARPADADQRVSHAA